MPQNKTVKREKEKEREIERGEKLALNLESLALVGNVLVCETYFAND